MINLSKLLTRLFLMLTAVAFIYSCAINPVTGKRQLALFSEAQEIEMGRSYDPGVIATFGLYQNDQLLSFIKSKGDEMGKLSHRPNLQYHFRILDSPVVNAFAVPGGYIYLTRGILAQFSSEAELMGVLGHEMGHITARHTVVQQSKQQLGQLLLIGGMIASEHFRNFADYAMQGMELLFLKFSRDNEREADRLGVEYASRIGYDAQKMADFFNVLEKMNMNSDHGGIPTFFSTHPNPEDRQVSVSKQSAEWKEKLGNDEWLVNEDSYLRRIDGIVYGEDPRQGYVDGNIFYHPELKFRFPVPATWMLENSPLQVQMGPKDGSALMIFMLAEQASAAEAAQAAMEQLNLNLLESKRTTVSGLPAVAVISEQVSQNQQTGQQQAIRVMSYFIEYDGRVYIFHGVTSGAEFNSYARLFESTMAGFSRLTEASRLNVQPKRIKVVQVQQNSTMADALRSYGVAQGQMNELALLNNVELNQQLPKGKLIKIISQ